MERRAFVAILAVVILLGFVLGFFVFAPKIKAHESPDTPDSAEPSVFWDETWTAEEVCYTTGNGYSCADVDTITAGQGKTAGKLGTDEESDARNGKVARVEYHPRARVSEWTVKGHVHFR